jgi:subtilisin family serine protease
MLKFTAIVGVVLFSSLTVVAQQQTESRLLEFEKKADEFSKTQQARAKAYAEQHGVPLSYTDDRGNLVLLVGVDEANTPLYISVDNAGAAATTNADRLAPGGELGLNLEGRDMVIGVWDGGSLNDHLEFDTRIIQTEGAALSDHATHVTGTIAASGINANAKGMAPAARIVSWDFNNDFPEMVSMARTDQTSLLLSNHSYGAIIGWRFDAGVWTWFGNASISNNEDYRFGFYSTTARTWDDLAFNAPYYTICKSAGNERTDAGNGTRPADCDGGSGFDCIGDVASAKNIITIGAVAKAPTYTDASSVVMSSFSSWGPTDDGRIKPDFVGAGVNLFSTFSSSTTAYGALSGTSMATPNVTGSLALLQELNQKLTGNFMKASTLKALAIHSTQEAGLNPGPDFKFGWGLLDVEAAAKLMLMHDESNVWINEEVLANNGTFEINLTPVAGTKITATIVWTDPAGTSPAASLDPTDRMLVNDLDIRIVDENGGEVFPWTLNAGEPNEEAKKGDDTRNNVEKIEFDNPDPRNYKLVVTHKGQLANGEQAFSIVLSYTSTGDQSLAYYWIDGSGSWSDPAHWALTSGGSSAGVVPGPNDRVFFDENALEDQSVISFSADAECASLIWFGTEEATLDLNDHTLTIGGDMIVNSGDVTTSDQGKIRFTGEKKAENKISFKDNELPLTELEFNGTSAWTLEGLAAVDKISLVSGHLLVEDQEMTIANFSTTTESTRILSIENTTMSGVKGFEVAGSNLEFRSADAEIATSTEAMSSIHFEDNDFEGTLNLLGQESELHGNSSIGSAILRGTIRIFGNNTFEVLTLEGNSSTILADGSNQIFPAEMVVNSGVSAPVSILSAGRATLTINDHAKLCFDRLLITNVDLMGDAVVSAGLNSQVTQSQNWLVQSCNDILFADFAVEFNCAGSLVEFHDTSTGSVTGWHWDFGDLASEDDISNLQNATHSYPEVGTYTVALTVSNQVLSNTFDKNVEIVANDLPENRIVESNGSLHSFNTTASYQWYRDSEPIEGATARSYDYQDEPGVYFVVTRNTGCNRVSTPYEVIVAGSESKPYGEEVVNVYPNPAKRYVVVSVSEKLQPAYQVTIYNILGRKVKSLHLTGKENSVSLDGLSAGMYTVLVEGHHTRVAKRIVIDH